MYYVYATSGPSLLIESTDSMIITLIQIRLTTTTTISCIGTGRSCRCYTFRPELTVKNADKLVCSEHVIVYNFNISGNSYNSVVDPGGFGGFDRTPIFGWLCYKYDIYCERSRLHGTPLSAF